jgi:hypothetical protein
MSRVNPYASIAKRTFGSALLHMLETDYGLLGGRRILQLLVEDIEALLAEFYPEQVDQGSGTLIWTCTADEGKKATAGKPTEAYATVTVRLPLITEEDLAARTRGKSARGKRRTQAKERDKARLARIVKAAAAQGGLLTIAELSVLLNKSYEMTRVMAREWEAEHGEVLPFKGYVMDQGRSPTHKREIVTLFETGLEPPDIARETHHALQSVERYLQDYERVRMLIPQQMTAEEISNVIGRGKIVVLEYIQLAQQYHPELFEDA